MQSMYSVQETLHEALERVRAIRNQVLMNRLATSMHKRVEAVIRLESWYTQY